MKPSLTVAIYGAGQVGRTVVGLLSSDVRYSVRGPSAGLTGPPRLSPVPMS